jgi:hypothetical protein
MFEDLPELNLEDLPEPDFDFSNLNGYTKTEAEAFEEYLKERLKSTIAELKEKKEKIFKDCLFFAPVSYEEGAVEKAIKERFGKAPLVSFGGGGYMKKTEYKKIEKINKELEPLTLALYRLDKAFFVEEIERVLDNIEYLYSRDFEDSKQRVLEELGIEKTMTKDNRFFCGAFNEAKRRYLEKVVC